MQHPDLEQRALNAYLRYAAQRGDTSQPSRHLTEVRELRGKPTHVILSNAKGELARYRVHADGGLRRDHTPHRSDERRTRLLMDKDGRVRIRKVPLA